MENLKEIEKELTSLIDLDKRNWTHFYLLLKEVEEKALWKEQYHSFTQWVKDFSVRNKTHESIIWNRKKAGQVYESYASVKAAQGEKVTPIDQITVSADSLVLLDKINKYNPDKCAELTEKVMNKGITKKDLREVYKSVRPKEISTNPHLKTIEIKEDINTCQKIKKKEQEITALDIVSTLCNSEWLGKTVERQYFKSSFEQKKYRTFTEFPVYTGTSRHSRRIDLVAVENIKTKHLWEINIHGIEIKVSRSDLLHDTKYSGYAEFVDYLWLAVPKELVNDARDNKFQGCGIIEISKRKNGLRAKIVEKAEKLDSLSKMNTLMSLVLKMI